MPRLVNENERETRLLTLPSSTEDDPAKLTVYVKAVAGDIEKIGEYRGNEGKMQLAALVCAIKEWNFTIQGSEGKEVPAPITFENVAKLELTDMYFIIKESGMMDQYNKATTLTDQKKKSS